MMQFKSLGVYRDFVTNNLNLQANKDQVDALMKSAKQNEDQVVKIQSWARGSKVRKDVAKQLAEVEDQ